MISRIVTLRKLESKDELSLVLDTDFYGISKPGAIIDFYILSKVIYSAKVIRLSKLIKIDEDIAIIMNNIYPLNISTIGIRPSINSLGFNRLDSNFTSNRSCILKTKQYSSDNPKFYSKNREWLLFARDNKTDVKLENWTNDEIEIYEILFELWGHIVEENKQLKRIKN